MSHNRTTGNLDPLVLQAEKILAQRQARYRVIDTDLLGEPGWDILLSAFIAAGRGTACRADALARELQLTLRAVQRWTALLAEREMIEARDNLIVLTSKAETILRDLFKAQLQELARELRAIDAPLQATNS